MSVRARGFILMLVGGLFAAGVLYIVATKGMGNPMRGSYALIGFAVPCVPFLMGLVELLFGVPISQVSNKWDALQGWQRGVLGTLIVLTVFVIASGLFIVAGYTGLI